MPLILFISYVSGSTDEYGGGTLNHIAKGQTTTIWETGGYGTQEYVYFTWADQTVTWYNTNFSNAQMNYKKCTYRWVAIG